MRMETITNLELSIKFTSPTSRAMAMSATLMRAHTSSRKLVLFFSETESARAGLEF